MSQNYYFLVAQLPALIIDSTKTDLKSEEFLSQIYGQIDGADMRVIEALRLSFDNNNLLSTLLTERREFDGRGNFDQETISREIKVPQQLPLYMQQFLESFQKHKPLFPGLYPGDELLWLFYEHMAQHPNEFIRQWYGFDLDLRNFLAGLNVRRLHRGNPEFQQRFTQGNSIIGRNDTAQQILKSSAPDFGLSELLPWVEEVMAMDRQSPIRFEQAVDLLRWKHLDELTDNASAYFHIETIAAFFIKLTMVERWKGLDETVGEAWLKKLVANLDNIPETTIITNAS
ncbi:MAG: DUF2764 family protein [Chitinivibrionales bacterium]|nr:DUF2764 family protein [Chitinivibrionales bacterium]